MASAMQLCTVMVVPAIRSDGTAVWQETQDSVFTRMNTFLTANSVSFTSQRKECREIAAAGIQNQTVVSGWIQSQNRFGMCTAFWDGAAATSQQGADAIASDAANQGILLPICDTDPAVIGYLQTIGMVRVCMMDYEALACSWTPSQGIESASFEAAPTYLFSTTPAGVDTVRPPGCRARRTFGSLGLVPLSFASLSLFPLISSPRRSTPTFCNRGLFPILSATARSETIVLLVMRPSPPRSSFDRSLDNRSVSHVCLRCCHVVPYHCRGVSYCRQSRRTLAIDTHGRHAIDVSVTCSNEK